MVDRRHGDCIRPLLLVAVCAAAPACLVRFNDWPLREDGTGGQGGAAGSVGGSNVGGGITASGGSPVGNGGSATGGAMGVGGSLIGGIGGSAASIGGSAAGIGGSAAGIGGSAASIGGSAASIGGSAPGIGGGGVGSGGSLAGAGGSVAGAGGSPTGTGGTILTTGGSAAGGTAAGGYAGGLHSGINWLSVVGDWADPGSPPNGALDISGAFYVFADACADLTWDPTTRCAWGVLCTPGVNYENWGISVGFDFRNTGVSGSPPNATLTWDPETVGAIGVAWTVSGSAPALQVWVLNMDPMWSGQCTAERCYIDGPPDGVSEASLEGTLYFDAMVKDDWNGAGTNYVFSPAATQSLQFKLPAVRVGGQSFDFCIDRLGIVLP